MFAGPPGGVFGSATLWVLVMPPAIPAPSAPPSTSPPRTSHHFRLSRRIFAPLVLRRCRRCLPQRPASLPEAEVPPRVTIRTSLPRGGEEIKLRLPPLSAAWVR